MTTIFHAWSYGWFTEIQSYLRRKKLHRMNRGSSFLGGSFNNQDNVRTPIQFNPNILKDDFSSRTDPPIFTSILPLLIDCSNKTTWVIPPLKSTSRFLPQSTMPHKPDSSSEANSSCCHRYAWSHLEQRVAVLQIKIFQLAGNCNTDLLAWVVCWKSAGI